MKLMSLFDGSGGFPLAASLCGIDPVYASEVEPYPIAVTKSRFPSMKHLGDVSMINGADIEPVDIITFGSPCQDMSVAGKRAGLKHTAVGDDETTRSGLFLEAIRIIKEMRLATNGIYPRFAVWENVPGAFSSNRGEDFRLVLEEFIRISEPNAVMPAVPEAGWAYADCINGDGWSVAYRTFDAQYWGVPQRRRRIYLVADFRGQRAGEILFKREGLRGHTAQSGTQGEEVTENVGNGIKSDDRAVSVALEKIILDDQGGQKINVRSDGKSPTLRAEAHGNVPCVIAFEPGAATRVGGHVYEDIAGTLRAIPGDNQQVVVYDARGNGDGETCPTITGDHNNRVTDYTALCIEKMPVYCLQGNGIDRADTAGCNGKGWREDKCYTLNTIDRSAVVYSMATGQANAEISKDKSPTLNCNHEQPIVAAIDCRNLRETGNIYGTLQAKPNGGQSLNYSGAVRVNYIVRRLTPTECARLQGFPDKWGHPDKKEDFTEEEYKFWLEVRNTYAKINGKPEKEYTKAQMLTWYSKLHTDSAEYKMWGNGIALPNALYVMQGIVTEADNR
ncbi:DNA cytosine methyltransferase [Phascolarctobacterium faecium]|uniref:DNA cytosine methyltransferase n=1 Tax=Phascolarctobacterium faecium TaxID=33025 RepID=UPI00204DE810|nr:MAG TPA: Cytosine specific methyltransferase [Caudoviricetes sp.]